MADYVSNPVGYAFSGSSQPVYKKNFNEAFKNMYEEKKPMLPKVMLEIITAITGSVVETKKYFTGKSLGKKAVKEKTITKSRFVHL